MTEFEIIKRYFSFSSGVAEKKSSKTIVESVGDDCAIIRVPKKHHLATSIDTFLEGRHFFEETNPADIAYKALTVNVSDLLAMGAKPLGFTLALSMPNVDASWLESFSHSLQATSELYQIPLIGGDTTRGPLSISVSAFGAVKKDKAVKRIGAKIGDDIWVTGSLGLGNAALNLHQKTSLSNFEQELWQHLLRPTIPFQFARKLSRYASAAIDVSDGLLADLEHITVASQVGAQIDVEVLPLSESLIEVVGLDGARQKALIGGDDYQLCFTAPKNKRDKIVSRANKTHTQVTRIGNIVERGLCPLLDGEPYPVTESGWQHFND